MGESKQAKLTRAVIMQAVYKKRELTSKKWKLETYSLEGMIKIKARSCQAKALELGLSGVSEGIEYYTVLPFSALQKGESVTFKKPLQLDYFKNTIYDAEGNWVLEDKSFAAANQFFYQNLMRIISDNLSDIVGDKSSLQSLTEVLKRRDLRFGIDHVSYGFPTNYLNSLLSRYTRVDNQTNHGIILTKARTYSVQFKQEEPMQNKLDRFRIGDSGGSMGGGLSSCVVIPSSCRYGIGAYTR